MPSLISAEFSSAPVALHREDLTLTERARLPTVRRTRRELGGRRHQRQHILLIEDDPVLREVLEELLVFEGFLVQTAANATESWQQLAQASFALIVTDLFVPSSQAAVERIRALRQRVGKTPIVVMTGTWAGRNLTADHLSADALFFKPFDTDAFMAQVRSLVRQSPPTLPT
jgi:DNA-binding response OmpR family regulator